ncbi:hypothetical protein Vspart_01883 [Vibrio spartinae]|uniref:Uncharacterized protein n=1 Tax=Vibrio spartinae TaxID=1918945 RepID=A0ABX6QZH7_9VIBR|nr:hypothetical protein Vspart_01883 [Vibrio spartinae]
MIKTVVTCLCPIPSHLNNILIVVCLLFEQNQIMPHYGSS